MSDKRHKITDEDFVKKLQDALDRKDTDTFFLMVYDAITEDPDFTVRDILNVPAKTKTKLRQLNAILQEFTNREDYEKCAAIKKIIQAAEQKIPVKG